MKTNNKKIRSLLMLALAAGFFCIPLLYANPPQVTDTAEASAVTAAPAAEPAVETPATPTEVSATELPAETPTAPAEVSATEPVAEAPAVSPEPAEAEAASPVTKASAPEAPPLPYDYYGDTQVLEVKAVSSRRMFSHSTHFITNKISCETCHSSIFEREYGKAMATKDDYNMQAMEQGKYCGVCHGDNAPSFPSFNMTSPEGCIKCHGTDMVPQDTIIFTVPVQTIIFDHKEHVDRQLACHSCHEKVFASKAGSAEASPDTFTMEEMYQGKSCGVCHNGTDAFAASTRCTLCHIGVKGQERLAVKTAGK